MSDTVALWTGFLTEASGFRAGPSPLGPLTRLISRGAGFPGAIVSWGGEVCLLDANGCRG